MASFSITACSSSLKAANNCLSLISFFPFKCRIVASTIAINRSSRAERRASSALMALERCDRIETRLVQDLTDALERQVQLAVEQDLLESKQRCVVVVAIAVRAHPGRFEQADVIVEAQRARGDPGRFRRAV